MRVLDLFCGAGGSARGYQLAGFEVTGVDIKSQPRYPGRFIQADALTFPLDGYDLIHASPPCQAHSDMRNLHNSKAHIDLIPAIRERLYASGLPWVIENVEGAPLVDPVLLCGSMFGLETSEYQLRRHRLFEAPFEIPPLECEHNPRKQVAGIYGGHIRLRRRAAGTNRGGSVVGEARQRLLADLFGVDWMVQSEADQAVPPAYAQYVGWAATEFIRTYMDLRDSRSLLSQPPSQCRR